MKLLTNTILLLLFQTAQYTYAYGNYFDSISTNSQIILLDSVINNFHIEKCCHSSLGKCLNAKSPCSIAPRFYNFGCWLIIRENSYNKIMLQLNKRYSSFFGPDTFHIDAPFLPPAGDTSAPIIITAYISASCPLCKKVCIPLYRAVTEGPIAGKAVLYLKPVLTDIGGMALMAAKELGGFWNYYLSLEKEKRRLNEKIILSKAKKVGLNKKQFKKLLDDEKLNAELVKSRNEALTNGVDITPTLFINNRRYRSYKDPQWVIDAVEYEYDMNVKK